MSAPPWAQQPHQPQAPEPKKKSKVKTCAGAGCLGIVGVVILGGVISVAGGGNSSSAPAAQSPAAASPDPGHSAKAAAPRSTARKETPQTVTYVVTGTGGADVQYGPAGSSAQGKVPMSVTKPLRNPQYYAITAQLQGGGHVTCQLKVNGKVISQSTASGGYNLASCEISKDIFSGKWTDTNAG
ncbi:hypothetical protein N8I84_33395 [Streptomyces cynarae]|uniref:MmpS family membrane protein n=1 Tax=Streptomyces cynarae TaxID=2981134 RepID=A0ABY6EGF3_9ACTN|nr:hypothetical protein [Streptomyces cynarae]UXY23053.1 hypothetical protein N8I84_33395 [Streptomyces cynarae]